MSDTPGDPTSPRVIVPSDVALSAVAEVILGRHPRPGDTAPTEGELIGTLRISRRSARRALDALGAAGVLSDPRPYDSGRRILAGTSAGGIGRLLRLVVMGGQPPDGNDLVGVRTAVERLSVATAADMATEDDLDDLRRLVARMRDPSLPRAAFGELDTAFHLRIAQTARGLRESLLQGLTEPISTLMDHAFGRIDDWPATARRLADEHQHLLSLVGARRGTDAADFVTHHVEHFYERHPPIPHPSGEGRQIDVR